MAGHGQLLLYWYVTMKRILVGYTKDHKEVTYDPDNSHVATHIADTPSLPSLVKFVLADTVSTGEAMWFETDMGRVIGVTDLVETDKTDDIIYAKRAGRDTYTRFTKSRRPQECRLLTVAIEPLDIMHYDLTSAWIGPKGFPFPDKPDATPESLEYWKTRALVWGTQEIQPGTETTDCPW